MLYALLCYDNEAVTCSWTKEKNDEVMGAIGKVIEKLVREGRMGPSARLMPTTAATTLRKGKETIVMDGPFAETKEQLLGFFVIDCVNLEAAHGVARELSAAMGTTGSLEVRPIGFFQAGGFAT